MMKYIPCKRHYHRGFTMIGQMVARYRNGDEFSEWRLIGRLFHQALELEHGKPSSFLEQACTGQEGAGSFLQLRAVAPEKTSYDPNAISSFIPLSTGTRLGPYEI